MNIINQQDKKNRLLSLIRKLRNQHGIASNLDKEDPDKVRAWYRSITKGQTIYDLIHGTNEE